MRTIDDQIARRDSLWGAVQRDLRLLLRIQRMLFQYFTAGARTRKAYRAKEAAGETYWVDE